MCVGAFGTGLQYGIYYGFLALFDRCCPELGIRVTLAFTIGFVIEMISNYLLTSFYTFGAHPNLKNASGFLLGRGVNYVLQLMFLHFIIYIRSVGGTVGYHSHRAGGDNQLFRAGAVLQKEEIA